MIDSQLLQLLILYNIQPVMSSQQTLVPGALPVELPRGVKFFRVGKLNGRIVVVCVMKVRKPVYRSLHRGSPPYDRRCPPD